MLHPPLTAEQPDFTPRPYTYVEPALLDLPSEEPLATTVVRGRTYHIRRVPPGAYDPARETEGAAIYENQEESLYFRSPATSGRESRERLIVEDCVFIIDFEPGTHPGGDFDRWDTRRGAIVVEGYKEVVIRNSIFISHATKHDPIRQITGSVIANYCLKVQIDNCYFEGASLPWRGHILAWGCGPTQVTNTEIAGARQGTTYAMGGGIWVAHGEKIGWTHGGNTEQMIYPNGPLRVENVHIHDQEGNANTDGIYVQSIQPYLIRNTKVENWKGQDSLVDIGFRDTFQGFKGKRFVNHGAVGVIEHCHFADGYVKTSVGLSGGLIFQRNVMRNAWMFPYVFDGGDWYVLGNRFEEMTGVIVSGRNGQMDGWTPGEGMFIRGSKMHLYGNTFVNRPGRQLPALFVNNNKNSPLDKVITSDFNAYQFEPMPKHWAIDQSVDKQYSLALWREAGKDRNSNVGSDAQVTPAMQPLSLPGGLIYEHSEQAKPGLIGPVGLTSAPLRTRARALSEDARVRYDRRFAEIEFEDMEVVEKSAGLRMAFKPSSYWSGRGTLRIEPEAGQEVTFRFELTHAGRYRVRTKSVDAGHPTPTTMIINGNVVDEQFNAAAGGNYHGLHHFKAGEQLLTFRYLKGGTQRLDRLDLALFTEEMEQRESSIEQDRREQAEARERAAAKREAGTRRLEAEAMTIVNKAGWVGVSNNRSASDGKYLLLAAKKLDDFATFEIGIDTANTYHIMLQTIAQTDRGKLRLEIDGKPVGEPQPLADRLIFGEADLQPGRHRLTIRFVEGDPEVKIRMDRIELK